MKLSVVTICFNAEAEIERTIKSVIEQDYPNIEYIVIDGKSTDKTVELIKKYDKKITKWISQPDKGLYDAMNKGLKIATGNYIVFMNAGDQFYDNQTVSSIFASAPTPQDVYYGETVIVDNTGNEIGMRRLSAPNQLSWKSFKRGMRVSHQSFIAKKELAPLYDLNYKFSADFDWCLKILKKSEKICNTNIIITRYLDGGLTKHNLLPSLKERYKIMTKFYGTVPTIFNHFILGTKLAWFVLKNKWF